MGKGTFRATPFFFISVLCLAKGSDKMRSRGGLAIWMKIAPSLASLVASLSWTQAKWSSIKMQEWRLCICLCLVCFKSWINPSSCLSLPVYSLSSLHWCAVGVGASSQNAADRESVSFISTKQIKKNALIFFFFFWRYWSQVSFCMVCLFVPPHFKAISDMEGWVEGGVSRAFTLCLTCLHCFLLNPPHKCPVCNRRCTENKELKKEKNGCSVSNLSSLSVAAYFHLYQDVY